MELGRRAERTGAEEVKDPTRQGSPRRTLELLDAHGCSSRKLCKRREASASSLSSCIHCSSLQIHVWEVQGQNRRTGSPKGPQRHLKNTCAVCGQSSFLQMEEALKGERYY